MSNLNFESKLKEIISNGEWTSTYYQGGHEFTETKGLSNEEQVNQIKQLISEVIGEDLRHATRTDGEEIAVLNQGNVSWDEAVSEMQKDIDAINKEKDRLRHAFNLKGE